MIMKLEKLFLKLLMLLSLLMLPSCHKVLAIVTLEKATSSIPIQSTPTLAINSQHIGSSSSVLDPWRSYEELRDLELSEENLLPFFKGRPQLTASRLIQIVRTLYEARKEWQMNSDEVEILNIADCDPTSTISELDEVEIERATKLCQAVSSLGPVAVKIAQTLSQRPDLVGVEVAKSLKTLQTRNVPYDNQLAYGVIHESLNYWSGPIATGIYFNSSNIDQHGPTLFAKMTPDPIACASLGQVYKATLHDGREIAVKVQRPDALSTLAIDVHCLRVVCGVRGIINKLKSRLNVKNGSPGLTEEEIRRSSGSDMSVGSVINRVASDIKKELDYRIEAQNSMKFKESLAFLGFVTTPEVIQATDCVLLTEWIPGRHLDQLSEKEGLEMTAMAVEACTASLLLTGFVHADPHEGNLMLHDDGNLVFLDFGLMAGVDEDIMEGFARGIQSILSQNWSGLTDAFVDVGFVTTPVMHRQRESDPWVSDSRYGIAQLAKDVEVAMKTTDGGASQFGPLATVLNKKISPNWLVFTPPYILLLLRTFLTLEGIAASIDPKFNIYEMAMPWAIRRSLSPSTEKGVEVFRSILLTQENKIQLERLIELIHEKKDERLYDIDVKTEISETQPKDFKERQQTTTNNAAIKDAVVSILGSSEGRALRRALKDIDTVDLVERLSSRDSRPLLDLAAKKAINFLGAKKRDSVKNKSTDVIENNRPVSEECTQLRMQQSRRKKRVVRFLVLDHVKTCLFRVRGLKALLCLTMVGIKVFMSNFMKIMLQK